MISTLGVAAIGAPASSKPLIHPDSWRNMSSPVQKGMSHPPKKSVASSAEAVTTCAYSAMKNIENFMAEYSVWYPVISSDSASGMSKGSRLVSASAEIRKKMKASDSGKTNHIPSCCCRQTVSVRVTLPTRRRTAMTLSPSATS